MAPIRPLINECMLLPTICLAGDGPRVLERQDEVGRREEGAPEGEPGRPG
jgi:hypothetical protein